MCSFENPENLVNEIITILASNDDKESVEKTKKILLENQQLQHDKEISVKTAIEKLTESSESSKANVSNTNDTANIGKIENLKTENSAIDQKIKQFEDDLRGLERICQEREKQEGVLMVKNTEVTNNKIDVLPKTKYYFSLFSNITHIRWDYNSKEDEIKGFVASLNDVKPFCLDTKHNSKYFTVNYLWDLISA